MSQERIPNLPPIMTLQEAADACRLHHSTLRRAIREGRLQAYRPTGRDLRITSSAIERWLEPTCTGSVPFAGNLKMPPKKKVVKPPSTAPATPPPQVAPNTLLLDFGD